VKAMILKEFCEIGERSAAGKRTDLPFKQEPLEWAEMPNPIPNPNQILVKVSACGVCHTELDEIEGRLIPPNFPIVLGHEIVGRVEAAGSDVTTFKVEDRVGIAWIYSSCGTCDFCLRGDENLCDQFQATGLHAHGGYAQYTVISEDFAYPIPKRFSDAQAAPLLCAGGAGGRVGRRNRRCPA
jgi:propanol-preferring alcohol dehydrogenase